MRTSYDYSLPLYPKHFPLSYVILNQLPDVISFHPFVFSTYPLKVRIHKQL